MDNWISVDTELPKINDGDISSDRVLVTTDTGLCDIGYLHYDLWCRHTTGVLFTLLGYEITHWMPLPEPPEKAHT